MAEQLVLTKFVEMRKEDGLIDECAIESLQICTQSIHHWLQFCQYHHFNLTDCLNSRDLGLDRIASYRRSGECVELRFVYEANIVAFLASLHALLDSFPYLLNLFIPKIKNNDSTSIRWHLDFIDKYRERIFYSEMRRFMLDRTFNRVKGYANTYKHRHLIRVKNEWKHLTFEDFDFRMPYDGENGRLEFSSETAQSLNVQNFIEHCHNDLVPKYFSLCNSILASECDPE